MMKYPKIQLKQVLSAFFLAGTVCLQMPLSVLADNDAALAPQTPAMDTWTPLAPSPATAHTFLNGSVSKKDTLPAPDGTTPSQTPNQNLNATANDAQLNPEAPTPDERKRFELAVDKLKSKAKMTADDYRDLQIGIVGYESVRQYDNDLATVEQVYPGCPASEAGIRVGDKIVPSADEPKNPKDLTQAQWWFSGGHAGTKITINLIRNGQVIPITLTRMNIEDMPDPKLRRQYEAMARKLLPSGEGTVLIGNPGASAGSLLLKLAKFAI